jgi:hypothetical protein
MRRSAGAVIAALTVSLSTASATASARPHIATLRATLTGVGPPGTGYEVIVTGGLRVCAQNGRLTVRVREQSTGFDDPPTVTAQNFRKFFLRQRQRCQRHVVRWKLGDRFFGIGVYRLRFQVQDADGELSRSVFRKFETHH